MDTNVVLEMLGKRPSSVRGMTLLSDSAALSRVNTFISTGCPPLDLIMGGGVPVGRLVEIYGDTSVGKTLLAEHILAETQAMGGTAVLLDTETAVDLDVAKIVGIDVDKLLYSTPDTVEEVFDDIVELIRIKEKLDPDGVMTIVWDSVAAASSDAEMKKVMSEGLNTGYPPTAKEISQMMRVSKLLVAKHNIALVVLNQTRENIGVMFGDKKATFGGRAIGFYASVRLELSSQGKLKDKGNIIGINTRAYVAKSKVSVPFGKCTIPIVFNHGIDEAGSVLEWLKAEKVIKVRGSWSYITIGDEELSFQGLSSWEDIYIEHGDAILDLMYDNVGQEEDE